VTRPADPIWDAVVETFGLHPVTIGDKKRMGKIVRDLKRRGATADEIKRRHGRYKQEWPTMACTPEALDKHWDRFGGGDTEAERLQEEYRGY